LAYNEFLVGLMRDPAAVSAPTPSGATLSNRMASMVDPARQGVVVELGPGTGVVTEALMRRGFEPARLILVERNPYFYHLLREKFPRLEIHNGDAFTFARYLRRDSEIAGVLSGVPLLNFQKRERRTLIETALSLQKAGGRFVQLSYGWRPAVSQDKYLRVDRTIVWRNFPPACIWNYSHRNLSHM
jgi:phosphatidylethanolamine/phosphatidyl-N-methylethanolamine N-methyltransferase